jgi:chromosome segregation ATPase
MPPIPSLWGCSGITYLCRIHKRAGQTLQARSAESSHDSWVSLYIFVGVLLTLFVATPFIAYLRKRRGDLVIQYRKVATKATRETEAHKAVATSFLARQDQLNIEKNAAETSKMATQLRLQEIQVLEEFKQREFDHLQQIMQDVRTELRIISGKREEAVIDTQVARQECQSLKNRIQELENATRTKDDDLKSLRQKYNHVDQEYRRQLFQRSRSDLASLEG